MESTLLGTFAAVIKTGHSHSRSAAMVAEDGMMCRE